MLEIRENNDTIDTSQLPHVDVSPGYSKTTTINSSSLSILPVFWNTGIKSTQADATPTLSTPFSEYNNGPAKAKGDADIIKGDKQAMVKQIPSAYYATSTQETQNHVPLTIDETSSVNEGITSGTTLNSVSQDIEPIPPWGLNITILYKHPIVNDTTPFNCQDCLNLTSHVNWNLVTDERRHQWGYGSVTDAHAAMITAPEHTTGEADTKVSRYQSVTVVAFKLSGIFSSRFRESEDNIT
ncbi:unnamed protein product [Orchesella dallaii]|uniref:Uncharacterized protein n=1 Tax=Orchesella dallaii TaxID=48710 RepID=A0ABP1S575_9HEXA